MLRKNLFASFVTALVIALSSIGCSTLYQTKSFTDSSANGSSEVVNVPNVVVAIDPNEIKNSPIDQVLKKLKDFNDFRILDIRQEFNTPESGKVDATVILTKEGIADDSINSEREIYSFKFEQGQWKEVTKQESWKCGRGSDTQTFHRNPCV